MLRRCKLACVRRCGGSGVPDTKELFGATRQVAMYPAAHGLLIPQIELAVQR